MLLLAEGETDEAWEPAKHNAVWEIGEHWMKKYFYIVLSSQMVNQHRKRLCLVEFIVGDNNFKLLLCLKLNSS